MHFIFIKIKNEISLRSISIASDNTKITPIKIDEIPPIVVLYEFSPR